MSIEKRTSLQQIAEHAGVTKMTVSRYIKDSTMVAKSTGERIARAIDELGYIPNRAPDLLSYAKSNVIGVLVPSLSNQVFSEVVRGIESITEPAGYQTMLAHYGYNQETEAKRIEYLLSYHVDALLLCENQHTSSCLKMLKNSKIPIIEMMDVNSSDSAVSIGFDNEQAAFDMATTMIKQGYKNIAYLAARLDKRTLLRQQGYERAMKSHGLQSKVKSSQQPSSITLGGELLSNLIKTNPEIDAVFCTNDDLAAGAVFECAQLGLAVPDEMGIAGFHGHDFGQQMSPKLASVLTPRFEIGKQAASKVLSAINESNTELESASLPVLISLGQTLKKSNKSL